MTHSGSERSPLAWAGLAAGGALLVGAALAAYLKVGARRGADELMHPVCTQPLESPEAHGLSAEAVRIPVAEGLELGAWFIPAAEKTDVAIAMFHGHSSARSQLLPYARFLRAHFNCLLVDFRGCGDSGGTHSSMSLFEAEDVSAAVRYLQARGMRRLGAWGMSMGGAAAIRAAAAEPAIEALVVDGTFDRVEHVIRQRARLRRYPFPGLLAGAIIQELGRRLEADLQETQPIDLIGRLSPRPLLVVHGTADTTSVVENGSRLYRAAGYPKELLVVPGAAHTKCRETAPIEYERRVLAFYRRALTPEAGS